MKRSCLRNWDKLKKEQGNVRWKNAFLYVYLYISFHLKKKYSKVAFYFREHVQKNTTNLQTYVKAKQGRVSQIHIFKEKM